MCVAKVTGGGGHPSNVASPVGVAVAAAVATPRQLSRLDRVVLEIVETEQAYVRDLKSIVEVRAFIQPSKVVTSLQRFRPGGGRTGPK